MEELEISKALSAIAHKSRLAVFRHLVQARPQGLPAGRLAALTGLAPLSLSFDLKELVMDNTANSKREGRYVIYSAKLPNHERRTGLTD